MRLLPAVLVGVAVAHAAPPAPLQKPADPQAAARFRSSTNVVEVDVIVKDKDGGFVSGLTADDFEVLEEGKPQPIQHFYLITENATASSEPRPEAVLPRSPDQTGRRVFLLMFDSDHLSATGIGRVKKTAMDFINEQVRPTDLAGVFVNGSLWRNRMSTDRQELLDGVRALGPAFETPASRMAPLLEWPRIDGEFDAVRIEAGDRHLLESNAIANCTEEPDYCAREGGREYVEDRIQQKARTYVDDSRRAASMTLQTLTYVARNLSRLEGRKTLLLISEGFFVDDIRSQLPQIAGQAARAGITIYTLNARGTEGVGGRMFPDASLTTSGMSTRGDTSEEGLDILSAETGGVAYRHTDNFARVLASIAADTSTYYVLAYSSDNTTLDGKFRRIELKSKWKGLTVRARRGYLATPLPTPKQIRTSK